MFYVGRHRRPSGEDPEEPVDEEAVQRWRERARKGRKGAFWKELPVLVLVAVGLAFLIQSFLARVYMIPSESMEQTLHGCAGCYGDRVLVDKLTYRFTDVSPGDVIVFHGPDSWVNQEFHPPQDTGGLAGVVASLGQLIGLPSPNEEDFVKRVVAVGGQSVECCDERNRVKVDGKPLDEPYVYWEPGRSTVQESFPKLDVPPGYLFVLGDNRNDSCDSRCQGDGREGGLVPVTDVVGKARLVVLPPSRWKSIDDHDPQAAAIGAPAWQDAAPLGVGAAAAWPVLLLGRRVRGRFRRGGLG
ncbi:MULTISPECIES: signal peptidase I [Actinosynnema]|uniref:Signal peptidase I n=1 Tax=Actinosynnema pretiosum TaxID=42197 RepID=A0A290ZCV9_9PSEU|nr:signal peptidase I [Actinosynnema pretiosum]ATE56835.1 signal peptidase I [Actinosynnema pretiosum]